MVSVMNQQKNIILLTLLVFVLMVSGYSVSSAGEAKFQGDLLEKINFDLDQLNDQGLYGPPNGLRALDYEFCIPADPGLAAQVKAIDPTLVIYAHSKGRMRCSREEYLCLGNTHQPGFRSVLLKLASLPFVKQINQCLFE